MTAQRPRLETRVVDRSTERQDVPVATTPTTQRVENDDDRVAGDDDAVQGDDGID
jgi:hypothetical protein